MSTRKPYPTPPAARGSSQVLTEVTIRFAGDAGDAMQLAGNQFSGACAAAGNDVCTLPDPPGEIRAPTGALAGVSGLQVHFADHNIHTPGDVLNALIAMNPAALRTHVADLEPGGILIVDSDAFTPADLYQAGYVRSPLVDGSLDAYRLEAAPITTRSREAVAGAKLIPTDADRCRNFFAVGLACWLYDQPTEPTLRWVQQKFAKNPSLAEAHRLAFLAGYGHGETSEALRVRYRVAPASWPPGRYRRISGNHALALGLMAAARRAGRSLLFAGYPIGPATDILHRLISLSQTDVQAVQAEDPIAAINMAIGAAFGGAVAATATSGPGLSLSAEALGLAVIAELPLVVIDVQRAGPATGLPTKPEQADLFAALFGRHGECPLPVLAPRTASDGFAVAIEAVRLAVRYMTPVLVLSDSYLAASAETWRVPAERDLPPIDPPRPAGLPPLPYQRDARLSRPWPVPGMPGLEHRTGGLEKEDETGNVSYDPVNHERMVQSRARKVAGIADDIPELTVDGPDHGPLLVVGWGSTFGAIDAAVRRVRAGGRAVATAHLQYLNPLPRNLGEVLRRYQRILVPELNTGQLRLLLRATYLVDAFGLSKVQGRPFTVREVVNKIEELLGGAEASS
jgi:2-oxoglutarate ferredoxin oxidoreductase subunit alpha